MTTVIGQEFFSFFFEKMKTTIIEGNNTILLVRLVTLYIFEEKKKIL